MRGLRGRLAVALVGLVAVSVVAIGIGSYVFVDARLRDGLLADASRQAQFDLSVLVPDRLAPGTTSATFEATGLPAAFRLRGEVEAIADFGPGGVYYSTAALNGALAQLPGELRAVVAAGHLGYAWLTLAGRPSLVIGGHEGVSPAIYLVFSAQGLEDALAQLRLGLVAGALIALALALATAGLISRGILRPVESASAAARRIATGDLSARVPAADGSDEFARWAREFNRMADSLETNVTRLEASQGQNRRFVAEVSHELRTPLTALVAEASLLESGLGGLSPDARRAAELLVADVRRLRLLVEDLMELSRFDAQAEQLQLEPVDLGRVVAAIVATRLRDARLALPANRIVVESDVRRLDRIVGNLLDNARVHAPGAEVDVAIDATDDVATVTVADRGPGVPPEALGHLFDRFFKVDPSRRGGSSGIGLAIAAEHAALLGGSISAEPRPGGGLVCTLSLPVTGSLRAGHERDTGNAEAGGASDTASVSASPARDDR